MSQFRLQEIQLHNYRCFEELKLSLEEDTTLLFAENGGGKTALLASLAMGLAVFQRGTPRALKLDARRDPTMRTLDAKGRREPVGPCEVNWTATVGDTESVAWSTTVQPASGRHHETAPTDSGGFGASSYSRRSLAVVRVVRRRSLGAYPRPAS